MTLPVGVDAGAAVGAGVGGAVVGAEAPYDAPNDRLYPLHLAVQRAVKGVSRSFFFNPKSSLKIALKRVVIKTC